MELTVYITPGRAELLTGVPEQVVRGWADSGRVRSATKRLYSSGHLVVRTADVLAVAAADYRFDLAEILDPLMSRCSCCGRTD